jgi:hypothetical protein
MLLLVSCVDPDAEKTYVVTCRFPQETFTDTIVTGANVWHLKESYRIDNAYYPTSFCTMRFTINEQR